MHYLRSTSVMTSRLLRRMSLERKILYRLESRSATNSNVSRKKRIERRRIQFMHDARLSSIGLESLLLSSLFRASLAHIYTRAAVSRHTRCLSVRAFLYGRSASHGETYTRDGHACEYGKHVHAMHACIRIQSTLHRPLTRPLPKKGIVL